MGIQINGQTDTVTATDGSINVGGDVTIPGVLTYEDVTNVDSVGIVTAQSGIHVTGGSVGIGTDTIDANSQLHIKNTSGNAKITLETNETYDSYINFSGATSEASIGYEPTSNAVIISNAADGLTSAERLRITSSGNVGINSTNPSAPLEIYTAASAAWKFKINTTVSDGAGFYQRANGDFEMVLRDASNNVNYIAGTSGALQFTTSGSERLRITSAGAVGINTTTPFSPLEIQGDSGTNDARITFTRHGTPSNNSVIGELFYRIGTDSVAGMGAYRESAMDDAYLAFYTQPTSGSYGERLRITSGGKIGVNRSQPQGILHVYTDTLNADNGYNGQNFGIVVETEDGNNDGDEGNGICFTQQYSTDAADSGKVRTGAIIGFKDQVTGNFGGGLKFKVQPFGAAPLSTSMTLNKSGNVGIGTESVGDKLVVHQGTDDDVIVRVNGADSTTEYAGLGVSSGYASVVAGGSGTTDTDLVFMTANQGTEAGRWRINKDGILYNMESGYTYNFKRYQGTMPNMTSNNWATVANTTTIADAGLWILTFGRFEQSQTGGTQWSVTYVGGPVYLHSANGNDGDTVSVPLYHMGHAQNGSAASCQLTYRSGGTAHTSGRVQFRPNGWSYTGTNAYYKFYKIADL